MSSATAHHEPATRPRTPVHADSDGGTHIDTPGTSQGHTAPRLRIVVRLDNGTHGRLSDGRLIRLSKWNTLRRRQYGFTDRIGVTLSEEERAKVRRLEASTGMTAPAILHAFIAERLEDFK